MLLKYARLNGKSISLRAFVFSLRLAAELSGKKKPLEGCSQNFKNCNCRFFKSSEFPFGVTLNLNETVLKSFVVHNGPVTLKMNKTTVSGIMCCKECIKSGTRAVAIHTIFSAALKTFRNNFVAIVRLQVHIVQIISQDLLDRRPKRKHNTERLILPFLRLHYMYNDNCAGSV